MLFEWDENKNLSNIEKHGISFEYASLIFVNKIITKIDDREDYGELREISLGVVDGNVVIVVVHTERNGSIRIISARKGKKKDYEYYHENITR